MSARRTLIACVATGLIASGITAAANLDGNALGFIALQRQGGALDIRPGGALPASSSFIRGKLRCADNVNAMLKANGYRGTGSRAARSFLTYGKAVSEPQPGVIQIERRGLNPANGHVQIVDHKKNGVWICKNPSSRVGAWVYQPCANPRVIAYRMPTAADVIGGRMLAESRPTPARVAVNRDRNAPIPAALTIGPGIVPASGFTPFALSAVAVLP